MGFYALTGSFSVLAWVAPHPSPPTSIVLVSQTGAANAFRLSGCGGGRDGGGFLSDVDGYF